TEGKIENMLNSDSPTETFEVRADVSGYVTQKIVTPGEYISKGDPIYKISDFSKVWVLFDVYESEMGWIRVGDRVEFTVSSLPGKYFAGTISYLDPVIDAQTRVSKARVEISNTGLTLKPEMFASGTVQAKLPKKSNAIVVPKTAVMWTGKRSVVYVKSSTEQGVSFKMRKVTLGPALGESYIIENGLQAGEEIAVNGTFSIDAAAQLAGKPSMMSAEGGAVISGHDHGETEMRDANEGFAQSETLAKTETDPAFTAQLTKVYNAYIPMKNAFVASDAHKVMTAASEVSAALKKVDMGLLKGDAHMAWMENLDVLEKTVNYMSKLMDIEKQRNEFAKFNIAFYKSIKAFGLENVTTYYQYCPMAEKDKGAYWFSSSEEIKNPYFGDAMLKCGENREVLK
ncbi:MAG TPA: efflux RND transporter periplasmic adaptor subunit, partial [Bacteroidales bacterium]|nr:efflux RND transporter periplasmic adaptor subunit [Bacteroidales bacterium]